MIKALQQGVILQNRYEILSLLGTGGSGFVYRVNGIMLKKELALKELYDTSLDAEDRKRIAVQFITETRTLSKLDHRGIPKVYDAFVDEDRYYIAVELVCGRPLDKVLKEGQGFPGETIIRDWMGQSLEILAYLHSLAEPVIVRDIKPPNIMLTPGGALVFIDFGIAKIFDPKVGTHQYIKGSGSNCFAPPEQYGSGNTDARTDIYALGVTFYYMLTGKLVPNSIDRMIEHVAVPPPSQINPHLSAQLETIIMKMIELSPQDRFQRAEEIQESLAGLPPEGKTDHSPREPALPASINAVEEEEGRATTRINDTAEITLPLAYCPQCGSRFTGSDQFCSKCGRRRFRI